MFAFKLVQLLPMVSFFLSAKSQPFPETFVIQNAQTGLYLTNVANTDGSPVTTEALISPLDVSQVWTVEGDGIGTGFVLANGGDRFEALAIGLDSTRTTFVATVENAQFNILSFPDTSNPNEFNICGTGGTTTCLAGPSTSGTQVTGGPLPATNANQVWLFTSI